MIYLNDPVCHAFIFSLVSMIEASPLRLTYLHLLTASETAQNIISSDSVVYLLFPGLQFFFYFFFF